jgi:hypothetical protein
VYGCDGVYSTLFRQSDDSEFQSSDPAKSLRFLSAPVGPSCADPVAADGNTITTAIFVNGRGGDGSRLLPYSTGGEVRSRPPWLPIKQKTHTQKRKKMETEGGRGRRSCGYGATVSTGFAGISTSRPTKTSSLPYQKKILWNLTWTRLAGNRLSCRARGTSWVEEAAACACRQVHGRIACARIDLDRSYPLLINADSIEGETRDRERGGIFASPISRRVRVTCRALFILLVFLPGPGSEPLLYKFGTWRDTRAGGWRWLCGPVVHAVLRRTAVHTRLADWERGRAFSPMVTAPTVPLGLWKNLLFCFGIRTATRIDPSRTRHVSRRKSTLSYFWWLTSWSSKRSQKRREALVYELLNITKTSYENIYHPLSDYWSLLSLYHRIPFTSGIWNEPHSYTYPLRSESDKKID